MYIIICIFFKSSAVPKLILFLSQIQLEMILLLLTGQTDTSTRGYQFHFPTSVSSLSVPFVYICFSETDIYVIETKKNFWESGATVKILRLHSKRKRKFSSLIRSTGKPFQSRENNKIISHLELDSLGSYTAMRRHFIYLFQTTEKNFINAWEEVTVFMGIFNEILCRQIRTCLTMNLAEIEKCAAKLLCWGT